MSSNGAGSGARPWLAYRSAPYAWERFLMWVLIAACIGVDLGSGLDGLAVALFR